MKFWRWGCGCCRLMLTMSLVCTGKINKVAVYTPFGGVRLGKDGAATLFIAVVHFVLIFRILNPQFWANVDILPSRAALGDGCWRVYPGGGFPSWLVGVGGVVVGDWAPGPRTCMLFVPERDSRCCCMDVPAATGLLGLVGWGGFGPAVSAIFLVLSYSSRGRESGEIRV